MFYVKNISIYMNFGGHVGDVHIPPFIFCLLFKKTEKVQEHDQYLNQILHHFDLNLFFLGWIIKIWQKGGRLLFFYEVRIVVLIDFIAILWIPGIFLIQIVNTNHTNVYLIHFHCKNNIKMHFPKSWIFKVSKQYKSFIIHHNAVK